MELKSAVIDVSLRASVKPVNKPTDKVILTLGRAQVSASAEEVIRHLVGPEIYRNGNAAPAAPVAAPSSALADALAIPIGAEIDGGLHGGLTIVDNQPARLILLPGDEKFNWEKSMDWAKKQGGRLPSRFDGLVLFANLKKEFKEDYYWTNAPYAGGPSYAWFQSFYGGLQNYTHKDDDFRARAVRSVIIQ